jgi:hypothetical protein
MLSELTEEQEALLPKVADYWVNLTLHSGRRVEKDMVEGYINGLYREIGLKKPKIRIFDSYMAAKVAAGSVYAKGIQVWSHVWTQVLSHVGSQVRPRVLPDVESHVNSHVESHIWSQIESLVDKSHVWSQVDSRVWSQVRSEVELQVASQVGSQVNSQVWSQLKSQYVFVEQDEGLSYWAGFLAYYDYFAQIGVINHKPFFEWRDYLKSGIWSVDYFDDCVIISRLPTKVIKDEAGRLHSLTEPAVQWADHSDNHFIHGVAFAPELWESVAKKTITAKDAISLPNVEQRTIACQTIGYDTVVAELGALTVDKETRPTPDGKTLHYQLLEIKLNDDLDRPAKFLKVECPSTGKETLLRVHPSICEVRTALAWTFRLRPEDYVLDVET